jgi:YceI-like protein
MTSLALIAALTLSAPSLWTLDAGKSKVSYHLVHKLHEFTGTDDGKLEGKARINDDGTAQIQIVGQVKDFSSGNGNRDEHMMETVEAEKFPTVTVKAKMPLSGQTGDVAGKATVAANLHGTTETVEAPLKVTFSGTTAHVTGEFDMSIEGFSIKRPSLLFVPINDAMKVTVDVWLSRAGS